MRKAQLENASENGLVKTFEELNGQLSVKAYGFMVMYQTLRLTFRRLCTAEITPIKLYLKDDRFFSQRLVSLCLILLKYHNEFNTKIINEQNNYLLSAPYTV